MSGHYTYVWLDESLIPYYVGKGLNGRAFEKRHRIGSPPPSERILRFGHASEEEAFAHERLLIAMYGRLDLGTGTLMNLTDGGAGVPNPSESIRALFRANGRLNGHVGGRKAVESGQLASVTHLGALKQPREAKVRGAHIRWHVNRGISNPACHFCFSLKSLSP